MAAYFVLPEPAERSVRAAARQARFARFFGEMGLPGIRRLVLICFLAVLAFSAMEATFAFLASHRFGLDQSTSASSSRYIGVMVVVVQGGLIGPLTRRFGEAACWWPGLLAPGGRPCGAPLRRAALPGSG